MRTPGLARLHVNPHPALHEGQGSDTGAALCFEVRGTQQGGWHWTVEWMNKGMKENRESCRKKTTDTTRGDVNRRNRKKYIA